MIKLSAKLEAALNDQFAKERASSALYLAMAAYLRAKGLNGFAHWMELQAREEDEHAMKLYHYLVERGGRAVVGALPVPEREWASALAVIKAGLKHEEAVSASILALHATAAAEKDRAAEIFLQWFITEQIEEESNFTDIVDKMKMLGDAGHGLFLMDRELARRAAEG